MGLSGRKEKQRIPVDPRNLTWADDAAKFGSNYLSKFGWDSSKGLGIDGDGRKSHVRVSHKLDMLGIGAANRKDPNGIAWKQNKDFELLLQRLNDESKPAGEIGVVDNLKDVEGDNTGKGDRKHKRKRAVSQEAPEGTTKSKRKKRNDCEDMTKSTNESPIVSPLATDTPSPTPKIYIPRHRAHRARAIASKSITSKSAVAIAEILGIAPNPSLSTTPSGSATPQGELTPLNDPATEKITTSTKSVADYFKDKLLNKASKSRTNELTGSHEPGPPDEQDPHDERRQGLGVSSTFLRLDTEAGRVGIPKLLSALSTSLASTVSIIASPAEPRTTHHAKSSDGDVGMTQKMRQVAKEERRRARAERKTLGRKGGDNSTPETN